MSDSGMFKNKDLVIAWLDGATIEYFNEKLNHWEPCQNNSPFWRSDTSYRISPKTNYISSVERITSFQTKDGVIFHLYEDAIRHKISLDLLGWAEDVDLLLSDPWAKDVALKKIQLNASELVRILQQGEVE